MSGGFFRGTSADQDTRFSNKQAKLMKSQKFAPELEHLVDMTKVEMDVMRPWIAKRVTELLGFEDEVLINFIYGLLEGKVVNGKEIQISITGFMEKNTGKFMKELWTLLLSAQNNASRVPQQFLDAKEEETRSRKVEADRIKNEMMRIKEKEVREREEEKRDNMEGKVDDNTSLPSLRHQPKDPNIQLATDEKQMNGRNNSRGRTRGSRSPHSAHHSPSTRRDSPSSSNSKSFSNSRSHSEHRSRSISGSPQKRGRSISSEKIRHSPLRRSTSPRWRDSPQRSFSPRWQTSHVRQRSVAPRSRRRSPSPTGRRLRSPMRHRSRSPVHRRSRTPERRRSRTPERCRSQTPERRRLRTPIRHRSRSPLRRRSRTPRRHRSRTPQRRRSRTPQRRRSRTPQRRRSRTPQRRRSRSPLRYRSPSPIRCRSRSPMSCSSPSPMQRRSPSPLRRQYQRSPSSPRRRSPSPYRRRSTLPSRRRSSTPRRRSSTLLRRRSSTPLRCRSSSPQELGSQSPRRQVSPSPARRRSPKRHRSPVQTPRDKIRSPKQYSPDRQPPRQESIERRIEIYKSTLERRLPISNVRSPQRGSGGQKTSHRKVSSLSPSPKNSPLGSESPPASAKRSHTEKRRLSSPYESPRRQARESMLHPSRPSPPQKPMVQKPNPDRQQDANFKLSREVEDPKHKSSVKKLMQPLTSDVLKLDQPKKSEPKPQKVPQSEVLKQLSPSISKNMLPDVGALDSYSGEGCRIDGKSRYPADHIKGSSRLDSKTFSKVTPKMDKRNRGGSVDSESDISNKPKAEVSEKRKHKRSKRTESDDDSCDSKLKGRKETKRRKKEEKRLKKEEKRRRRKEHHQRKEEQRAEKIKLKSVGTVFPPSDIKENHNGYTSDGDIDEIESEQKKLEIELRERALESLRAKKGTGH